MDSDFENHWKSTHVTYAEWKMDMIPFKSPLRGGKIMQVKYLFFSKNRPPLMT